MAGKWFRGITPRRAKSPELDTSVAHPARVYDYWLGGKDNFAADREAAEAVIAVRPGILRDIRENRKFLIRAVRYLAAEAGIRQFLDLGTGIPTSPNVHEAAQQAAPECRVVYVDNDPIVLAHARALLASSDEGATAYLDADLRDPEPILRTAAQTLDFSQPVGVILVGVLHLISDDEKPEAIIAPADGRGAVRQLPDAHPAGQRRGRRGGRGGRAAVQQPGHHAADPAQPRRGDPLLRRAGPGRAGGGAAAPLAAGPGWPAAGRGVVQLGRRGPQAVTLSPGRR